MQGISSSVEEVLGEVRVRVRLVQIQTQVRLWRDCGGKGRGRKRWASRGHVHGREHGSGQEERWASRCYVHGGEHMGWCRRRS